jgi:hypothetical protein
VPWSYDGTTLTLVPSSATAVATLSGADGILFDPSGTNLLVGGQKANVIYQVDPATGSNVAAPVGKNAYHLTLDPSGNSVWTFGTYGAEGDAPGAAANVPLPINPSTPGTVYTTTTTSGAPYGLTQVVFLPAAKVGVPLSPSPLLYEGQYVILYTSSPDHGGGDFGYLAAGNGSGFTAVPLMTHRPWAHGIEYDPFSGDLIATGANQIAQISPATLTVVSTYTAPTDTSGQTPELDQVAVDGSGQLFAADNHGDVYFIDYAQSGQVGASGNLTTHEFLATDLDDLALPPAGCTLGGNGNGGSDPDHQGDVSSNDHNGLGEDNHGSGDQSHGWQGQGGGNGDGSHQGSGCHGTQQSGFVTGGGWITSPAGALAADPSGTFKGTFGFVAKEHTGGPQGNTEFQLHGADLNFHSTAYTSLSISGCWATFSGTGTINGSGSYTFTVTVKDDATDHCGGSDEFGITIADAATGQAVYTLPPQDVEQGTGIQIHQ